MPDEHTGDSADGEQQPDVPAPAGGEHETPDGAPVHPLIDLSRDPTPGKPDHARPEDD